MVINPMLLPVCMYSQTSSKQTHSIQMSAYTNMNSFLSFRWFHINVVLTSLLNTNTDTVDTR